MDHLEVMGWFDITMIEIVMIDAPENPFGCMLKKTPVETGLQPKASTHLISILLKPLVLVHRTMFY